MILSINWTKKNVDQRNKNTDINKKTTTTEVSFNSPTCGCNFPGWLADHSWWQEKPVAHQYPEPGDLWWSAHERNLTETHAWWRLFPSGPYLHAVGNKQVYSNILTYLKMFHHCNNALTWKSHVSNWQVDCHCCTTKTT